MDKSEREATRYHRRLRYFAIFVMSIFVAWLFYYRVAGGKISKNFIFYNLLYVKELLLFLVFCFLMLYYRGNRLYYVFAALIGIIIFFFRNNLQSISPNKTDIVSPSSSKIIHIRQKNNRQRVFTYLSPLDRHFAIAPVDCRIKSITKPVKKNDAERVKISCMDDNNDEFSIDLIVAKPVKGVGIFGGWIPSFLYENRIVPLCKTGDTLKKGDRYGLIRFGSNMEYYFPNNWDLNVKEGQHIQIGDHIGKKNYSPKLT